MLIRDFLSLFEQRVPPGSVGYAKDAVGLQIGLPASAELSSVLCAYEVTEEIVDEAVARGANLILAFHPLIFPNLRAVTESDRTGVLVRRLIKSEIAVYITHTAFDANPELGTNRLIAEVLGLENIRPLAPLSQTLVKITVFVPVEASAAVFNALLLAGAGRIGEYSDCSFRVEGRGTFRKDERSASVNTVRESVDEVRLEVVCEKWNVRKAVNAMIAAHPYEEVAYDVVPLETPSPNFGMGAVGEWGEEVSMEVLLSRVQSAFGTPMLRHNRSRRSMFRRIAVVGGAGMDYYGDARANADAFITADVRYHDFYRAEHDGVLLIDAGHAETERFVRQGLARAASRALDCLNLSDESTAKLVLVSDIEPNAVRYYRSQ